MIVTYKGSISSSIQAIAGLEWRGEFLRVPEGMFTFRRLNTGRRAELIVPRKRRNLTL